MKNWTRHIKPALLALACGGALLAGTARASQADDQARYPERPVRFISCCAGIVDAVARILMQEMQGDLKQPLYVEDKPGASGMIGAQFVANAKPDGYTLLFGSNSTHAADQSLFKKVPYDYLTDFTPVAGVGIGPVVLVVRAQSPVKSVAELTDSARKEPGKLSYGWASSSTRMSMELYKQLADVKIMGVAYKTNPEATQDLLGGRIDAMFADTSTAVPLIKSGSLRALAVSGDTRMASLPDIPTMKEVGVDGFSLSWWVGIWAPAKTPKAVVARLNEAVRQALKSPKVQSYFQFIALDPMPLSPEQLQQFETSEREKWARIVSLAGIEPQ